MKMPNCTEAAMKPLLKPRRARDGSWMLLPTILLGLYLYDYGGGRRMPLDLLQQQCETALKFVHAGRIQGIVFLTITNDADALAWVANWIKEVGGQKPGARARAPRTLP
jgi:hypothetical protein